MAQTRQNKLFQLVEAFKLGGDNSTWTDMLTEYLEASDYGQYGIAWAFARPDITGNALTTHTFIDEAREGDFNFAGMGLAGDTDYITEFLSATKGSATITGSADGAAAHVHNLMGVRENCRPTWEIFAAGSVSCLAADTTTLTRTIAGALISDMVFLTQTKSDDTDQICSAAITAANTLTITVAADPGAVDGEHEYDYVIIRRCGNFTPSHRIVAAGLHTSVGGAAAEAVAISNVLATDKVICMMEVSDDTDVIVSVKLSAGVMTVTSDADPLVGHKWAYAIVRAV